MISLEQTCEEITKLNFRDKHDKVYVAMSTRGYSVLKQNNNIQIWIRPQTIMQLKILHILKRLNTAIRQVQIKFNTREIGKYLFSLVTFFFKQP